MELRVYRFEPSADGFRVSPPCVTLETYLAFVDLPYESITKNVSVRSKTRTIPALHVDGHVIGDTENIIRYLESKLESPLDAHLGPEQAHLNKVFWRLINTSIHQFVVAERWTHPEIKGRFLPYTIDAAGMGRLGPLGAVLLKIALARAVPRQVGLIRHLSQEERLVFVRENFSALDFHLGDDRFLFGEQPSTSDCYLYSYLYSLLALPFETPIARLVKANFSRLVAYYDRIRGELDQDRASPVS